MSRKIPTYENEAMSDDRSMELVYRDERFDPNL
jgi:hypothetical protein